VYTGGCGLGAGGLGGLGHTVAQLAEELKYKPEGCGFDSRWCHWKFSLTSSFRPHCGPKDDSASYRKEYQEYFLGSKDGRCAGLTNLPPLCAACLEIWQPLPPRTLRACRDIILHFQLRTLGSTNTEQHRHVHTSLLGLQSTVLALHPPNTAGPSDCVMPDGLWDEKDNQASTNFLFLLDSLQKNHTFKVEWGHLAVHHRNLYHFSWRFYSISKYTPNQLWSVARGSDYRLRTSVQNPLQGWAATETPQTPCNSRLAVEKFRTLYGSRRRITASTTARKRPYSELFQCSSYLCIALQLDNVPINLPTDQF
jgi:hypothetical protein